jgi:peptidoglycan/xylan/chitin deacetylase (PgdA/CDA1 family)
MPALSDYLDEHRPYFTRHALARWVADGHAVGLHTHTHPDCARLDDDGVRAEIVEPARRLSAELGVASLAFSYPFGRRCSAAHERMLAQAGVLQCALGVRGFSPRGTSPFRLERASIEGEMRFSVATHHRRSSGRTARTSPSLSPATPTSPPFKSGMHGDGRICCRCR